VKRAHRPITKFHSQRRTKLTRRIATTVLTLGVAALLAIPAVAQQPKHKGHGSRMPMGGGAGLIANQDVQKELKLTKEQTSKAEAGARRPREVPR
jgi:Spy/CpxP family protein refolding chaperone